MKLRIVLLAAVCAVAAPFVTSAQAPGSLESDLASGREYMAANNPSAAAVPFRQAVMKHPDNAEANLDGYDVYRSTTSGGTRTPGISFAMNSACRRLSSGMIPASTGIPAPPIERRNSSN